MSVQDLKTWHWIVIGLLLGSALGASRLAWPAEPVGRNLKQRQFERLLVRQHEDDPELIDVTVHPPPDGVGGGPIVTGRVWDPARDPHPDPGALPRVWVKADQPFRPLQTGGTINGADPGAGTVTAYLDRLHAAGLILPYRLAWWERPWAMLCTWAAGGALLVGGIWPVLLKLLVGAGLGRSKPEEPARDRDRLTAAPAPPVAAPPAGAAALTPADRAQLAALEAALRAQLTGESVAPGVAAPAPMPAPTPAAEVEALSAGPLDAAASPAKGEDKEFGADPADYYPTEIHGPRK